MLAMRITEKSVNFELVYPLPKGHALCRPAFLAELDPFHTPQDQFGAPDMFAE
jgi:hypothetical protein